MKIRRQIMMALCAMAVSLADAQTHAVEPSLSIAVINPFKAQIPQEQRFGHYGYYGCQDEGRGYKQTGWQE